MISNRGNQHDWVASYDGFYQTQGHCSNNASASLHDYQTGLIAWYQHQTKHRAGHNWEGTSGGTEGDILNSILPEVKEVGFKVAEAVMDLDSSLNAIFCHLSWISSRVCHRSQLEDNCSSGVYGALDT